MSKPSVYLKVTPADVAPYAILSGDPQRVEKMLPFLDNVRIVAVSREYHTYCGTYKDVPVTISSTGIGGPSAAIAVEELYDNGVKVIVRLGTVMGLRDELLGCFQIPKGAVRMDGTSTTYAPLGYPAIADPSLVASMIKGVKACGFSWANGLISSVDGFYNEMKSSRLSQKMKVDTLNRLEILKRLGVDGVDMESATMLTVGSLMEIPCCVVTMTTVLANLKEELQGDNRVQAEEKDLIFGVLEGLKVYHEEHGHELV